MCLFCPFRCRHFFALVVCLAHTQTILWALIECKHYSPSVTGESESCAHQIHMHHTVLRLQRNPVTSTTNSSIFTSILGDDDETANGFICFWPKFDLSSARKMDARTNEEPRSKSFSWLPVVREKWLWVAAKKLKEYSLSLLCKWSTLDRKVRLVYVSLLCIVFLHVCMGNYIAGKARDLNGVESVEEHILHTKRIPRDENVGGCWVLDPGHPPRYTNLMHLWEW